MRVLILAAAVAAVSLAGCGKKEETGLQVTQDGKTVTVGEGGVKVSAGGDKATAPDFAPIYPGAKVESTVSGIGAADSDTAGGTASFTVKASPAQVIDFYKKAAGNAGLTQGMDVSTGDGATFSASDEATKRMMQVMVSGDAGGSNVQLIWARPKG